MKRLQTELDNFWEWACMTREDYSHTPDFGDWETGYPNWDELYSATSDAINLILIEKESIKIEELLSLILDAIAIDNNTEIIIKNCQNKLSHCQIFYEIATVHMQSEARRQVAELIGKIGDINYANYLRYMIDDESKYVQRSALLSLAKIIPAEAEEISFRKLIEKDEYIRLFSLRLLKELDSSKLDKAVEVLKNDDSIFIKQELLEIKEKNNY